MARKGQTIATDLFSATRRNNSVNGNPRFDLHTSDGTFTTQSDAACSYDVDNITRTIPRGETIPVVLHTTPAGRVWNIERRETYLSGLAHDLAEAKHDRDTAATSYARRRASQRIAIVRTALDALPTS